MFNIYVNHIEWSLQKRKNYEIGKSIINIYGTHVLAENVLLKFEILFQVSFNSTPVVHVMVTWDYAYRAARRGPWEEIARDNERFKRRINSIAVVLDPILKNTHRLKVWQERFASSE